MLNCDVFVRRFIRCNVLFDRVLRMTTQQAQTLFWFIEKKSMTQRILFLDGGSQKNDPPSRNSILQWKKKFLESGSVLNKNNSGHPPTTGVDVESVRETFLHRSRSSVRSAEKQLDISVSTVHKVLGKKITDCMFINFKLFKPWMRTVGLGG